MEKIKLGNITKITSGGTPNRKVNEYFDNGSIPWIKTGDLKPKDLFEASEYITPEGLKNSSAKLFPPKTVLIALYGATIGACSILRIEASTNQACAAILPTSELNEDFLYYYLSSIKEDLIKMGVGGAQPNISGEIIKNIEIPLPPIPEQQRIVALLDKAESLRQKRRQSLALMDEFLKSTFLEMFGDSNEIIFKQPVLKLSDVSDKINDGEHGTVARTVSGFLYLMARNITHDNCLNFNEISYISEDTHKKIYRRCNPKQGDLLLVCVGATIGKCVLVPKMEQFSIARSVALIKPNRNKINSRYLLQLFNSEFLKRQLNLGSNESAQAGLYIGKIKEILIPVPSIELQNKFATIVEKTEATKEKMKVQLVEMDNNFNGLMAEVFGKNRN